MDWRFPMWLTIRCYQCGTVYDAVLTSEERHQFPCPACGKVEVYDLAAMKEKVEQIIQKKTRGSK